MERNSGLIYSKYLLYLSILFILSVITVLTSISIGSVNIGFSEILSSLFSSDNKNLTVNIISNIRIPRVLLAFCIGGSLSVCGAIFQSVLRNPLAEPYILGVSGGGAFGAVLAMLLGISFIGIQAFAFLGALGVIFLVYILGKRFGELDPNILLLSGVMVSSFFGALILLMLTFLNEALRDAVYWIIGNISSAQKETLYYVLPVSIVGTILLSVKAHKLNVLSLGDEQAKVLGVQTKIIKRYLYIITSLMVGSVVSASGLIGFVGLLIPHFARMIFGVDNRIVVPASFFIGAIYLTFADTLSRTIVYPAELPVGAVTSIIGAPVFIYLLKKRSKE